jgi:hypothetical protein
MKLISTLSLKTKLLALLFVPVFLFGIIWWIKTGSVDKRDRYERFLQKQMSMLPDFRGEENGEAAETTYPDKAAIQDYFMTLDPETGVVPRERLLVAYQQTVALEQQAKLKSTDALEWEGTDADMGGRTRTIMWDPNDASGNKVWAGGVTGGLWYRNDITDNQSKWQPVNDFWSTLNISCMTYDPNDPMTFYVGTGEAQTALIIYRESGGVGQGIWKSSDGGETWNQMESTMEFEYVTDVKVRIEDGVSVIYAGVASGIYR